jgi:hypothetical protein
MIPGSPQNVKVVGRGSDRVKLSWKPPVINPEAVEEYVVWKRIEGGEWEEVITTKKTKALVTGLKAHRKYEFNIIATNSLIKSLATSEECVTHLSKVVTASIGGVLGLGVVPFAVMSWLDNSEKPKLSAAAAGAAAATAPLALLLAPVTVPVGVFWGLHSKSEQDDLTPVSEDEL